MKSKDFTDRLYSIETRNRFGLPNGLGFITCGVSALGDDNPMAGIYQRRKRSMYVVDYVDGNGYVHYKKRSDTETNELICRLRHYVPTNPRTEIQQNWRAYFTTVLRTWQALSPDEKKIWNEFKYPAHMTGWNRFASYHLKKHDL
jgi:hypothetical protein